MVEFREAVRQIVENVPSGLAFDSHYVINQLLKKYSDEYIVFVSQYANSLKPTFTAHQQIGHAIDSFNGSIVQRMDYQSWSETIHGDGGECALWRRI